MNINKKTTISIVLALLMIASTLSVMPVNANELTTCGVPPNGDEPTQENLEVTKMVLDGSEWVDLINAEIDDTVSFKITVTYYNLTDPDNPHHAKNIVVKDILPSCLNYSAGSASPFEPALGAVENELIWNVPDVLYHEESYEITFNATVIECSENECGENINTAEVYAYEQCTGTDLYAEDTATVIVECEPPCEPGIEVNKTVRNGEDWAKEIDGLKLGDLVEFKIDITYDACDETKILNMIVKDDLPCCLEYFETIDISSSGILHDDAIIDIVNDGKTVYWNWTYSLLELSDGDTLTILFNANVTQYCEKIDQNCVNVTAAACPLIPGQDGKRYYGDDCVSVDCRPPEPKFEKTVLDGEEWVNEINTTSGNTLRFKLSLVYYGEEEFEDIRFKDILPCILEYADNAIAYVKKDGEVIASREIEGDLQSDNKTVFFNISHYENFTLSDGVEISVEFDAVVIGTTGGCGCDTEAINEGYVGLYVCNSLIYEWFDTVTIRSQCNCPPSIPLISGPQTGIKGQVLTFNFVSSDSDNDKIKYDIAWGDGSTLSTTHYDSDEVVAKTHTYSAAGTYKIKARAVDEKGATHGYTPTGFEYEVVITEEEISLCIALPRIVRGKISATIKNTGGDNLAGVIWEINATGGLLGRVNVDANGTVNINKGASANIDSGAGSIGFGVGKITGFVKATVGDYEKQVPINGLILGKIVIISTPVEAL